MCCNDGGDLPLPGIRAFTPVFDGLCGERVGVRGNNSLDRP
jgi:hypothetical protein